MNSDDTRMQRENDVKGYAVLFVDDEDKARKYFARALAPEMEVYTAGGVAEALSVLEEHASRIAVLVTDQRMPEATGVQLLRQARARWPQIVRMLTTAYTDLEDAIDAVNSGEIFRYINKPWDVEALRAEVRQAKAYFALRHERDLLLQEKLNARQRLVYMQRARDLIIMSGSFPHLRNTVAAVTAYLSQVGAMRPAEMRDKGEDYGTDTDSGPWIYERYEIERSLRFAKEIWAQTIGPQPQAQFAETVPIAELLSAVSQDTGLTVAADARWMPVRADALLLHRMFSILAESLSSPVTATGGAADEARGTGMRVELRGSSLDATDDAVMQARLLAAYLIAYHHGGHLTLRVTPETGAAALAYLPEDASAAPPVAADEDWVDRAMSPFEFID